MDLAPNDVYSARIWSYDAFCKHFYAHTAKILEAEFDKFSSGMLLKKVHRALPCSTEGGGGGEEENTKTRDKILVIIFC